MMHVKFQENSQDLISLDQISGSQSMVVSLSQEQHQQLLGMYLKCIGHIPVLQNYKL